MVQKYATESALNGNTTHDIKNKESSESEVSDMSEGGDDDKDDLEFDDL